MSMAAAPPRVCLVRPLAGIPRHSYLLATKVFGAMSDTDRGLSRAQIVKQLDASLKRLGRTISISINATALTRKLH